MRNWVTLEMKIRMMIQIWKTAVDLAVAAEAAAMADRPGGVAKAKMVSCLPVIDSCLPFHRRPAGVPFPV